MKKKDFIRAADNHERIRRDAAEHASYIGPKVLTHISEQNIQDILRCFDKAYARLIDENENPGRQEFCLKTNAPVGTDAIVAAEDITEGAAFEVVCGLGTPKAGKVKIALISSKDMPTTNLVHGFYGPYRQSGKAGMYTMAFGRPGMSLPKDLGENESEQLLAYNRECHKFWNGEGSKNGHVCLATPEELKATIRQMKHYGLPTKTLELRLEAFFRGGEKSPLKEGFKPSQKSKTAVDLGEIPLESGNSSHAAGKTDNLSLKPASKSR